MGKTQRKPWRNCCPCSPSIPLVNTQSLLDCLVGCKKAAFPNSGGDWNLAKTAHLCSEVEVIQDRTWSYWTCWVQLYFCLGGLVLESSFDWVEASLSAVVATLLVCPRPSGIFDPVSVGDLLHLVLYGGGELGCLSFSYCINMIDETLCKCAGYYEQSTCRCNRRRTVLPSGQSSWGTFS